MLLLGNPQSAERNLLQGKKTKKPLAQDFENGNYPFRQKGKKATTFG